MLFLLLKRRIQKWWSKAPWLTLLVLLTALYVVGYVMMLSQEPAGSPIRSLSTYTYFFVITVTTVGFGDVVPVSTAGRLTAGLIAGTTSPKPTRSEEHTSELQSHLNFVCRLLL